VVKSDELPSRLERIAGVDVAYARGLSIGAAVVLESPSLEVVSEAYVVVPTLFPYIPTLLSFREVYPALLAVKRLGERFDILFVDGNGVLHPFRAGFASHLGVVLDVPAIGIAKKLLCGRIGEWRGRWAPILDGGEVIGAAVRTSERGRAIYVSIGHKVSLETAVRLTLWATRGGSKLPEPIRAAHSLASRIARDLRSSPPERAGRSPRS